MCIGNNTDESQLTYTVCGFPAPNVTWGSTKGIMNNAINATKRDDLYYAHDYSLPIKPNMCEKVLHFKAAGFKGIIISWSKKVEKDCKSQFHSPYYEINYLLSFLLICVYIVSWVRFDVLYFEG